MKSGGFEHRYGPWGVVAGASEGLGAAFAGALARRGINVVLLARRQTALDAMANALRQQATVDVRTVAMDLAHDPWPMVRSAVADLEIGSLVYNAAYAPIGPFLDQPLEDKLRAVDVNCRSPLALVHALAPAMVARRRGGIVLVSSMAGRQGSAMVTTYAATKAFGWILGEGLWDELAVHGVDVLSCCAGATQTPNYQRSGPKVSRRTMEPDVVAEQALDALGRVPTLIPGWHNRFAAALLGRILPRGTAVRLMGRATRQTYGFD